MRRDIVFMHIPKTAGTSLREALEQTLRDHIVLRDYGREPQTTPELYDLVYTHRKISKFRKRFNRKDRGILLSGHFPTAPRNRPAFRGGVARYWDHFNAESFVTFARHPIDRIYSQYAHFVNWQGWTAGFEEFISSDRGRQRCRYMSHLLSGADMDRFGFIGFMEEYDASVAALSRFIGADLPVRRTNVGDYHVIDPEMRKRFEPMLTEFCEDDLVLYERLRRERGGIYVSEGAGPAIADKYIGQVLLNGSTAEGWLCNKAREFIAEVDIFCDGERIGSAPADRLRKRPKDKGHSRTGVCGFEVDLAALAPALPSAQFTFRARGSDYELHGSPLQLGDLKIPSEIRSSL